MRQWTVLRDRPAADSPGPALAEPAVDVWTSYTSPAAPPVTAENDEFRRGCVVSTWPQVALDGQAAVPIIAPEEASRRYIARILQKDGYKVSGFAEPQAALSALVKSRYDVVVLSGREDDLKWFCAIRRVRPDLPVLFVLEEGDPEAVARVLDAGADCLAAPFMEADLIARAKLLFRGVWRQRGLISPDGESRFRLDPARPRVHVAGRDIALTEVEYRALWTLAQGRGGVLRFCDIERSVWGDRAGERRIALHRVVQSLRRKMAGRSDDQSFLKTERSVGYRLLLG